MMSIAYAREPDLPAAAFQAVLRRSGLAARRPADDLARLGEMLRNADLVVTARDGKRLVGVSRAITDFAYCCYLSDLAVDEAYQRQGIGRRLIEKTRKAAGETCTLILLSAPAAADYYGHVGMTRAENCWTWPRAR
jgi:ribosomal protein S18 acetylase RimI-like enzyme